MSVITIGIPCYQNAPAETLEDYMRFAYYCGRRLPQHEFFLAIKNKSEQFRARNAICETAIQVGSDYLFFLDDDHVLDWENTMGPSGNYGIIDRLVKHMEADPKMGVCGGLYYHRGAECRPVVMKEGPDGAFYWMREDQIINGLQEVGVTGGGCMLLRMSMFDRIKSPWFEPEFDLGTDIQICKKARSAGYTVWCDTSIKVGHVLSRREVITPRNRHRVAMENAQRLAGELEGMNPHWKATSVLQLYRMDAEEYMGRGLEEISRLAIAYGENKSIDRGNDPALLKQYYGSLGHEQLARQVMFHSLPSMVEQAEILLGLVNNGVPAYGVDFGCGSAPVTFEFVMNGHRMDFIDVDGAGAYEFLKWRAKKRGVYDRCGWTWGGPYDYAFLLDSLEHIPNWQEILGEICDRLKNGGGLITNYFMNMDYDNKEHVSMDKAAVQDFLVSRKVYPVNRMCWMKSTIGWEEPKKQEVG